jgi:hypothetical protein
MSRGRLLIGLVVVMSALALTSSSALAAKEFRVYEKSGTLFKGTAKHVSKFTSQSLRIGSIIKILCDKYKVVLRGLTPGTSLTGEPTYEECSGLVSGVKATAEVKASGCTLTFFANLSLNIECAKGTSIVAVIGKELCTVKAGSQSGLKETSYAPLDEKVSVLKVGADITNLAEENSCGATGETAVETTGGEATLVEPAEGTFEVV